MDCALPAQKEKILATRASEARSTENKARAEASFKKEERAKEGAKAMLEYQANGRVVREQMARLKALRLAKEAAAAAAPVPPPEPAKKARRVTKR
ncbi:MAG: transcriptional regulator [Xanthobacteraceae bacterium]